MAAPERNLFFYDAIFLKHRGPKLRPHKPGGSRTSGQQDNYAHHYQTDATAFGRFEACEWLLVEPTKSGHGTGAERSCGVLDQAIFQCIGKIKR